MLRTLAVGATLISLTWIAVVSAQEQGGVKPEQGTAGPEGTLTKTQPAGMSDNRLTEGLAFLKATLRLSPDQEKFWSPFEGALHALANVYREQAIAAQMANPTADPTQRLRQRAAVLSRTSDALSRVAEAQDPLYRSLDEPQKRRFAELSPVSHARRIALDFADDYDRRVGRDGDVERRRSWRDQDSDRPRRYGRDGDGDRDWRDRDYRRPGGRDDRPFREFDRSPYYGRYLDRDSGPREGGWRDRDRREDYRRPRWHDRDDDRRDRGYDRRPGDEEDDDRR